MTATVRRRNAIGREGPGDVSKGPRGSVLTTDPVDDRAWEHDRASGRTSRRARAGRLDVLRNEALEFVDRNETLTPRGLDRVDRRHNSAVDRGDAYAESLSRLAATIGEAWNVRSLSQLEMRERRRPSGRLA